jgi:hypothetical protein
MKELIGAVIFVVGFYSGTAALKAIHDNVRKAALEKASHGLPSLQRMNKSLKLEK